MLRWVAVLGVVVLIGCGTLEGSVRPEPDSAGRTVVLRPRPGPAVALSDAEFAAAMSWLTEDLRVPPREAWNGRVVPASFEPDASRGMSLVQAEQLRQGYESWCASLHQGPDCKEVLGGGGSFTSDAKDALAIAIALASAWGGVRDEALATISPERLTTLITTALMSYTVLWTLPEPTSKSVAAGFTVVLWGYLGREFLGFVSAWLDMKTEVSAATTFPEVRAAGERFGHRMGQKTLRLVVMVATAIFAPKGSFEATVSELPGYAEAAAVPGLGAGELAAVGGDAQLAVVSQGHLEIALQTGWAASSVVGDLSGAGSTPGGPSFAPNNAAPVREPNSKPPEAQHPDKQPPTEEGANGEPLPLTERPPGFKAYSSHKSFKRAMGSPGEGNEWHHLVEQTPSNVKRFGGKEIHNTVNEVKLERILHRDVSKLYSSIRSYITGSTKMTIRQWLSTQSYESQRAFGLTAIENVRKGVW